MSTDIMVGGYNGLTTTSAPGGQAPNLAGCTAVIVDSTAYPAITYPNGAYQPWDWQPIGPAPLAPNVNNYFWCNCGCWTQHCCKCTAQALEATLRLLAPKGTAPMTTSTLADNLLTQAKSRIAEIQKRLDEVPALEAELARLRRMADAAEGK